MRLTTTRRVRLLPVLATGLLLALTACGSGQTDKPQATETNATTAAAPPGPPPNPKHSLELARKFAPLVFLGKDEKYRPMDAARYLESAKLMWNRDGGCPDDTVDENPTAQGLADPNRYKHRLTSGLPLCQPEGPEYNTTQATRPLDRDELGDEGYFLEVEDALHDKGSTAAPAYVQYVDGDGPHAGKTAYVYWFFYPWNEWTSPGGVGGNHQADWERVTVVADAAGNPEGLVYAHHGSECRVKWPEVAGPDGRPKVYSAVGTHGSYPVGDARYPMDEPQAAGHVPALDDHTSTAGEQWRTWETVKEVEKETWWGYGGGWGKVGGNIAVNLKEKWQKGQTGPAGPSKHKSDQIKREAFTDKACQPTITTKTTTTQPGPGPKPKTKEAAIQRLEQYLHAFGKKDVATVCEIAGPSAKATEEQGLGPCPDAFRMVIQMFPPDKLKAAETAKVDPKQVKQLSPDAYEVPDAAITPSVEVSPGGSGLVRMRYLNGNWFLSET